jgi:hypothetical protein
MLRHCVLASLMNLPSGNTSTWHTGDVWAQMNGGSPVTKLLFWWGYGRKISQLQKGVHFDKVRLGNSEVQLGSACSAGNLRVVESWDLGLELGPMLGE